MIFRAKAPLRVGLGGGGTDLHTYADEFGGAILNATITMHTYASIEPLQDGRIILQAADYDQTLEYDSIEELPIDGSLDLLKGVYNRIVRDYTEKPLSFKLTTYSDAPPGSGLGSSSTLVVAILGAFAEWLRLPLGDYDIAHLAYEIERIDLGQAGGRQDQYAATFGGFNFMEFHKDQNVIVNPLRIRSRIIRELEFCMVLYYTSISRHSSEIIEDQLSNISENRADNLEAMHRVREQAYRLKESLLKGNLDEIGPNLHFGWINKKATAPAVSNPVIDEIYEAAISAGATGGKISGAGGGGFSIFYCPGNSRYSVINALKRFGGEFRRFNFTEYGLNAWRSG